MIIQTELCWIRDKSAVQSLLAPGSFTSHFQSSTKIRPLILGVMMQFVPH